MLPAGVTVFERGWLSANNILLTGSGPTVLVDSGYCRHAQQTLALVNQSLSGRSLDVLINTHLHSDHCGGNSALQEAYPDLQTWIPPGHASAVQGWDEAALTFRATGQSCPRFRFQSTLQAGSSCRLGSHEWEIHAAPGHDPHSVVLFSPSSRTLISADALWENGFGVVFPELEGVKAFEEVGRTLDLIADLAPQTIIPGHGAVFTGVEAALDVARRRLDSFQRDAVKHAHYAAKVLLKFRLLEIQHASHAELFGWAENVPYLRLTHEKHGAQKSFAHWLDSLVSALVSSSAAAYSGELIVNR